jgi:GxxExxY protein
MEQDKTQSGQSNESKKSLVQTAYKYSELTSKIIGCAMAVHKALGNGFQEVIYQRALAIEMSLAGIDFNREFEMPIFYRDEQIGTRRVDFLVEGIISVELKAITVLEDVHFAQAINYLEAYNLEIGLLINFGERSLNFKRLTNKKFKPEIIQSQKSKES